jgi:hypothetical protein
LLAAFGDAALQDVPLVAPPLFRAPQREVEVGEVLATDVASRATFQVIPDPFDGIEIGSVARGLLEMEPLRGSSGQEVLDRLAAVNGGSIPNDEELAGDLA